MSWLEKIIVSSFQSLPFHFCFLQYSTSPEAWSYSLFCFLCIVNIRVHSLAWMSEVQGRGSSSDRIGLCRYTWLSFRPCVLCKCLPCFLLTPLWQSRYVQSYRGNMHMHVNITIGERNTEEESTLNGIHSVYKYLHRAGVNHSFLAWHFLK